MKITMYELLGLIKDGKAPKKIKIVSNNYNKEFYFDGDVYMYKDEYEYYAMTDDISIEMSLNDEVEILEEEKKIPEKLNWKPKESMAGELTQKEQIEVIARRTEKLKKEFNNLLDYLKSKGE